jgi:hypothetical protein
VASPFDWSNFGYRVVEALHAYFREGKWLLAPATLVDAQLTSDPDGVPVLLAIYDHPGYVNKRLGLRRRLDHWNLDAPEAKAEDIAIYDISEPLGNYYELLVEDGQGVWWWGDGYPQPRQPGAAGG